MDEYDEFKKTIDDYAAEFRCSMKTISRTCGGGEVKKTESGGESDIEVGEDNVYEMKEED